MKTQDCVEIVALIGALTVNEGDSVIIHPPNPDWDSDGKDNCVGVSQSFSDSREFYGASLLYALKRAYRHIHGRELNGG